MNTKKSLFKCAAVLSLAITGVSLAQSVSTPAVAFAAVNTTKAGSLTSASGTAKIMKVGENANKQIEMDYSLDITLPKEIKSGDTVRVSTINLGDFIPSGETKAPILIDGVEVGTLTRIENANKRYEQNSPESTLAQKKAANIEAGTQDNTYVLTFNSKASEYASKTATLRATSNLVYATTVKVDTPIRAQIFMNGQLLATKDYTLTATKPAEPVKSQKTAIDFSRNTRMQVITSGNTQSAQNFLGMIVMPLDRDYGKGSTIEVELPAESMARFVAAPDYNGKALTHFPVLTAETETNANNVYLYDQQAVSLKVKSLEDNKVVFEIVEGTMRKGDSYVGLPTQTGANFALTSKAEGKLAQDGSKIGPETLKTVIKTADGTAGETQGNTITITINGGEVTAEGIKALAAKKVTTSYIVKATKENLKDPVTGDKALPAETFDGYELINTETTADGNVIHYYQAKGAEKKVTTDWMYTNGEKLKDTFTGDKAQDKEDFTEKGAIFKETKVDNNGNTIHLYVKAQTEEVRIVTNHVDIKTGQPVADQEEGEKPKRDDIKGYKFVETKTDKDGIVTHYYESEVKAVTRFIELGTKKELAKEVEGDQPKKDIDGYDFVETNVEREKGITIHYYKAKDKNAKPAEKKVTKHLEVGTNKELSKSEDGDKPKKDIDGYEFVETKADPATGETVHYYKAKEAAKLVTRYLEQGTNKELDKEVEGKADKKDLAGYTFVETTEVDGVITHFYKAAVKVTTKHLEVGTDKELAKAEEGTTPKREIDGYVFKETKVDSKTGDQTHYYEKASEVKAKTKFVDIDTKKDIVAAEDGKKDKRALDGYDFVETKTDEKTGETVHYYKAKAKAATAKADTKAADKKAPVDTAGGVSSVVAPLVGTLTAAVAGVGAWFATRKRDDK